MQEQINNSSMLKVGTILRGTYRIDSYLSSGGFGNTYVATNIEFEERVAIKEFFMKGVTHRDDNQTTVSVSNSENTNSFLEQKEKFKKEARRLRKLKNEYIVSVHDLFEENGTAYYVMDYVDGESLAERLKRTGKPMTESEVREILPQILDALKTVHDASIWHLDLKPANIMLTKEGKVKLIDFGASKQLNTQKGGATTSTAISYTNGYAPREQMEQNYDKFGPWTDIYALGATIYNMLTNKRPPLPSDIDDDMSEDKHLALPFPDGVSTEMKNMVLVMLNTNRLQRPQSVESLIGVEKTRGFTPQQLTKQQVTSQRVSSDDEETLIATPKPQKEEREINSKNETNAESLIPNNPQSNSLGKSINWSDQRIRGALFLALVALGIFIIKSDFTFHSSSSKTEDVSTIESEDSIIVKFEQAQIEASIFMHIDSIAAEIGQVKFPIFNNGIRLPNNSIGLINPSIDNIEHDMSKFRLLGVLDVNRRLAKLIGSPTEVYDKKITALLNDINYSTLTDIYQHGYISDLSYNDYKKMEAEGKINIYWQIAIATIVEQLYFISHNSEKIIRVLTDLDVANITFRLVLVLDAVWRLSYYDPYLAEIVQAIVPLKMIDAISKDELKSQLIQVDSDLESAHRILIN